MAARRWTSNGGLLVNNGAVTGTTNVHFNGAAVGTGTYGPVNVFENGRFAPGASASPAVFSPAVVGASQASFGQNTTLEVQIGGKTPGVNQDLVSVAGQANLAGTLAISNAPGFSSPNFHHYTVLTSASRSGVFTSYSGTAYPWPHRPGGGLCRWPEPRAGAAGRGMAGEGGEERTGRDAAPQRNARRRRG